MTRTGLIVLAMISTPALAQDASHAADRALAPFVDCRHQADSRARALCYDTALDTLQQAVAARQVVIVDRDQIAQDRRTTFGFGADHPAPVPRPARAAKPARAPIPADVAAIDSTIVSAQAYGYDQWTIRIATGAVWRTTESGVPIEPKPGTKIHIARGAMNGFMLKVGSFRAVRAMRVG